ncbi:hypothetical protein [Kitasatospora herbaricolor]|uniref:hypothetical protein n=1 Tax=Kitasatospora herbaricolor TaxID=68217 RepID=UPI0036DE1B8F
MTESPLVSRRVATARKALCGIAVAACLPYLVLKLAWLSGSTFGVDNPGGSEAASLRALNALTVVMEAIAVAAALALTRPWGKRLPAWLPTLPMWIATGLLGNVLAAVPISLLTAGSGDHPSDEPASRTSPAAAFVGIAVNGGLTVQGLTLIPLFALYVHERWGHLLRGRIADLADSPTRPVQQLAAVSAALLSSLPLTMHLLWATRSDIGQSRALAEGRNSFAAALEVAHIGMTLAAATAGLLIAFRLPRQRPLVLPLALGWTGAGSMTAWGGWLLIASLIPTDTPAAGPRFPPLAELTYAVQLLVGVLVLVVGACALAERAAHLRPRPTEPRPALGQG